MKYLGQNRFAGPRWRRMGLVAIVSITAVMVTPVVFAFYLCIAAMQSMVNIWWFLDKLVKENWNETPNR